MLSRLAIRSLQGVSSPALLASRQVVPASSLVVLQSPRCLQTTTLRQKDQKDAASVVTDAFSKSIPILKTALSESTKFGSGPEPAKYFGLASAVPFVLVPTSMLLTLGFSPGCAAMQVTYGAIILGFLGGMRWGASVMAGEKGESPGVDFTTMGHAITPSVIAWAGMMMAPTAGLFTVLGGHMFSLYSDYTLGGFPRWFGALRYLITLAACGSLVATILFKLVLPAKGQAVEKAEE